MSTRASCSSGLPNIGRPIFQPCLLKIERCDRELPNDAPRGCFKHCQFNEIDRCSTTTWGHRSIPCLWSNHATPFQVSPNTPNDGTLHKFPRRWHALLPSGDNPTTRSPRSSSKTTLVFLPPCRATPPCRSAVSPSFSSPTQCRRPSQRTSLQTSAPGDSVNSSNNEQRLAWSYSCTQMRPVEIDADSSHTHQPALSNTPSVAPCDEAHFGSSRSKY